MNETDPLKELFKSLPEIEPTANLKNRILSSLETGRARREFWILKPAMAFASYLLLALLGSVLSINYLQTKKIQKDASPILRWTQVRSDTDFLKRPI